MAQKKTAGRFKSRTIASIALSPTWLIALLVYLGTVIWTFRISLTSSKLVPVYDFVGFDQYRHLMVNPRWLLALENMLVFGVAFIAGCLIVGFLLAAAIDRKIRGEAVFRTVFLYPYALSFIVTGLVWQWSLNPTYGIQATVRGWGWETFTFDWLVRSDRAIYVLAIAGIWQATGLVMALMLAGLRSVDPALWAAARVDGIPLWRTYVHIIIPELRPVVLTATVLLGFLVVKVYDLVVAMTRGGPGNATDVPAKFVVDYLFTRANIGMATAASVVMLVAVIPFLVLWYYAQRTPASRRSGASA
ncbi:MAG: sugar ABC transporter permease [Bauldia sp.]|nr:sugar ABC transporter permease [Bauldia sp.]